MTDADRQAELDRQREEWNEVHMTIDEVWKKFLQTVKQWERDKPDENLIYIDCPGWPGAIRVSGRGIQTKRGHGVWIVKCEGEDRGEYSSRDLAYRREWELAYEKYPATCPRPYWYAQEEND